MTTRNLRSVKDFAANGPFSESQLRWFIFRANDNGLAASGALVRVGGRRVYIDADGFDRWIAAQNPDGPVSPQAGRAQA
ncbi:hypothetical protein LYSHEL_25470 [Lysobacter helvus]|uniref:DNA-binding protein n=2 Tax=Lysobacteraceae TaxID=32033 RepID=A0ABN6G182_9GAMM|nr:hypothetical protein LYSCAS_25470 [Lysobacter caseinilyticus]BCT96676.1 hypothetical protein LYSHEL_25470 [Lysobacter helvus]